MTVVFNRPFDCGSARSFPFFVGGAFCIVLCSENWESCAREFCGTCYEPCALARSVNTLRGVVWAELRSQDQKEPRAGSRLQAGCCFRNASRTPATGPEREHSYQGKLEARRRTPRRSRKNHRAGRAPPTSPSTVTTTRATRDPHDLNAPSGENATSVRIIIDQRRVDERHGPLVADVVRRDRLALQ